MTVSEEKTELQTLRVTAYGELLVKTNDTWQAEDSFCENIEVYAEDEIEILVTVIEGTVYNVIEWERSEEFSEVIRAWVKT